MPRFSRSTPRASVSPPVFTPVRADRSSLAAACAASPEVRPVVCSNPADGEGRQCPRYPYSPLTLFQAFGEIGRIVDPCRLASGPFLRLEHSIPPASDGAFPGLLDARRRVFRKANLSRTSVMYSPGLHQPDAATQYGAFPLRLVFWIQPASPLDGGDPEPFVLIPFESTSPRSDSWHRIGRNFACAL